MNQNTQIRNIFIEGLLRYLTPEQLAAIQSKKIGMGGAGGLGSNCAMILVRTGFSNLEIIDQDVIDPSNLNRQQFYHNEVGQDKVAVLKQRLLAINPEIRVAAHKLQWNEETGDQYFKDADFIIEAFDVADWKYRFVDYYQPWGRPVVSGVGMAGLTEKQPMTVKKMRNIWFVGDRATCSHRGHPPMAPRVTQCAAMMAEIVLDLTLSGTPS